MNKLEVLSVLSITLLAVISPGADFAMVTRNSMIYTRRVGLLTSLGIALGVWVHVAYTLLGFVLIISKSIVLFSILKFVGAAYLIYLGIQMLQSKATDPLSSQTEILPLSDYKAFRIGFLTNALNPKTTLFVVAIFTQMVRPETSIYVQIGYGAFISIAHLLWFIGVTYVFSSAATRSLILSFRHRIEQAIGGVLVTLGLGLALSSLKRST
ncbi:MAG: LysE family transporter [Verrucomicrobiota bacterium]